MDANGHDSEHRTAPPDFDQRQSHRLASMPEPETAILKVGRKQLVVNLLNESAGGFALQLPRPLRRVAVGDSLLVRTRAGWDECSVVYLNDDDPSETRIGLQRIVGLPDPRDPLAQLLARPRHRARIGRVGAAAAFLALALGAAVVGWALIQGWLEPWIVKLVSACVV